MDTIFAIVELMGHNVIAGRISEENIAGTPMLRVDVPTYEGGEPAYTKFFSGAAVYAITPTDEGTATRAAQRLHIQPISPYIVAPTLLPPAGGDETSPAPDREPEMTDPALESDEEEYPF